MMMFVMAPFAAGLLIYWCTSNTAHHRANSGGCIASIRRWASLRW